MISVIKLHKTAISRMKRTFKLTNYQVICLSFVKGVLIGALFL